MNLNTSHQFETKNGPSLGRHALVSLLALCLIPALVFGVYKARGNPQDAISSGSQLIAQWPDKPSVYNLESARIDLPDLLDVEDVATVATVIPQAVTPSDFAGPPDNVTIAPQATTVIDPMQNVPRQSNAPKVVMIDGRPLGDGDSTLNVGGAQASIPPGRFLNSNTSIGPLARAPIYGLTRSSPFGQVPAPNTQTGETPLSAYARPFQVPPRKIKTVALIVGGLGINSEQTRRAINTLPPEVTLSFAAHAEGLQSWINQARSKGHEVLLELPMEPYNFDASAQGGQYVLRTDAPASTNIRNLDYLLSRAQGYFGVTNYLGEKFLDSPMPLSPVIAQIQASGLGFIYDGLGQSKSLTAAANSSRLAWVKNRSVIDVNPNQSSIEQVILALENSADGKEIALGMGFSYPATIDAIAAWHEESSERDIILAPASAALKVLR